MTCRPGHLEGEPIPEEEGEGVPALVHWLKHQMEKAAAEFHATGEARAIADFIRCNEELTRLAREALQL